MSEREELEALWADFLTRLGPRGGKTQMLHEFAEAATQLRIKKAVAELKELRNLIEGVVVSHETITTDRVLAIKPFTHIENVISTLQN